MENIKIFTQLISSELHLQEHAVENTLKLLDEGCTIPFISRYRKERTGGLDEVQITAISNRCEQLQEIAKRKETVIKTITELEKMTPELQKRYSECGIRIGALITKNPEVRKAVMKFCQARLSPPLIGQIVA